MVLKSDTKRDSVKKFISWHEEQIENLERGNKGGSKEGVQTLKGGNVSNVVEPQMDTSKQKRSNKDDKGWYNLRE